MNIGLLAVFRTKTKCGQKCGYRIPAPHPLGVRGCGAEYIYAPHREPATVQVGPCSRIARTPGPRLPGPSYGARFAGGAERPTSLVPEENST
jgi:hypothetical protein